VITAEQLNARTRGVGGSDAHVLAGVGGPGNRTLLDLWSRKRRGPNLELEPMVPPEYAADKPQHHGEIMAIKADPKDVGNAMESAVVMLYENQTGFKCHERETYEHPEHPWARANPDRLIYGTEPPPWEPGSGPPELHGLECKLVGRWAADAWGSDGLPSYVVCQVQWCMACSGLDRWDVCAWIAGTEVRIVTVLRDDDMIAGLLQLGESFWTDHVLADRPPPPQNGEDLMRFLGRRYPKDNGEMLEEAPEHAEHLAKVAKGHAKTTEALKKLRAHKAELTAVMCAYVGEAKGIAGPWGRFTNSGRAGSVSWKKVAEHLAGGPVSDDVLERFRGAPCRVAKLYPHRAKLTTGAKRLGPAK